MKDYPSFLLGSLHAAKESPIPRLCHGAAPSWMMSRRRRVLDVKGPIRLLCPPSENLAKIHPSRFPRDGKSVVKGHHPCRSREFMSR